MGSCGRAGVGASGNAGTPQTGGSTHESPGPGTLVNELEFLPAAPSPANMTRTGSVADIGGNYGPVLG